MSTSDKASRAASQGAESGVARVVTCVVVGAGERGTVYSQYATEFPERLRVVAVCEPRVVHRERLAKQHKVLQTFDDWKPLLDVPKLADFAIIATQDQQHCEPAVSLAKHGYHLLLEKPMATTAEDCHAIAAACKAADVMLCVCHVLRYSPANRKISTLIASGAIGEVVSINHTEPVGYYHFAHSFVRGNWRNEAEAAPALLAKCCHDVDLIRAWMLPARVTRVSSFGSLSHFTAKSKPPGAADRCVDCAVSITCPYSAEKIYMDRIRAGHTGWPVSVVAAVPDIESVGEALASGPYGRCVYSCDNDVCDHQIVAFEFDDGRRTATLNMVAFTEKLCVRQTHIFGTRGQIDCTNDRTVSVFDFTTKERVDLDCGREIGCGGHWSHGGADFHLIHTFVKAVSSNDPSLIATDADDALSSHLLVFAAEEARKSKSVVNIE